MSKDKKRSGAERAAILLMTLGEAEAAQVLKHMGAKDVQKSAPPWRRCKTFRVMK